MVFPNISEGQIATRVFLNPSFESPATGCISNWSQIPQTEVLGWKTTDTGTSRTNCGASNGALTNPIELWTTGFNGINAQSGNQYAEINATMNGYLYQNVCMLPNESYNYSIWHHRRTTSGTDTMRARITDSSGTLINETGNLSSSNNSWNNFLGSLSNNGTAGTRRFGYVAISTATGDISVGNLIDNTSFAIRPLVDIKQFNTSTILENGGTGNLEIYVSGTLRSNATVVLTKTGTATITSDYTVGSASRGTTSVDASGNITLTLPAGDYDPNFSSGTTAGLITIPFTAVNDAISDNNETAIYTVGTVTGGGNGTASLDLVASVSGWSAACSTAVSTATLTIREPADLTIAKSHAGSFTVGSPGTYSFTVTNAGGTASSGAITVTDTLPTGLTVNGGGSGSVTAGGTNGANWTCNSNATNPQTITCTSSTAITASGTSIFNFAVNVGTNTPIGTNSITNSASVSGGGQTNTANDSATDPTTVLSPNLAIAKSHTGNFVRGSTGTYTLSVSNSGTASTSGTITITDTLPTGLTVNGGTAGAVTPGGTNATNWTCNSNAASPQIITCTSSTAIAVSGTSVFTFAVDVSSNAAASVTNNASVSGGGEATANNSNNSATDPTTTVAPTDLTLTKSHAGSFTVGSTGTYSLTVTNSGGSPSSGTITVTDTLPTGLTVNGGAAGSLTPGGTNGANWTCNSNAASPQVITCTSSTAITASGTSVFNLAVNVGMGTAVGTNSITNSAAVSGGGDSNAGNNSATDPTTVLSPNLTIAKSHTGSFTVGSTGTYSFSVGNSGTASTSGTITVSDTLPTGLTVNGGGSGSVTAGGTNGANWTCNSNAASPQVITCTSSTAIVITGTSVFTFAVNVGINTAVGTSSITNSASVSGGGEATANNGNNSSSDPTTVLSSDLTIAKSHSGNFTKGATGIYTLTVSNGGTASTSGIITVTDTLPTGLSIPSGAVSLSGTNAANWTCNASGQIITCLSSNAIATSGTSIFSFNVNVSITAPDSFTNTASVTGGSEATANNGNNTASDPTNTISNPPKVELIKSCPSPANCTTAPQLPGTDITYQIQFTNTGGLGAANMILVDRIPDNMDYKVSSASVNAGTTGLTFAIEFSIDYDPLNPTLATWGYTPLTGGGSASVGYDRLVKAIRWRVTSGTLSNLSPNNTGSISFITKIR